MPHQPRSMLHRHSKSAATSLKRHFFYFTRTMTEVTTTNKIECKLKAKCPNKLDPGLYNCWDPDCDGWMHQKCSEMLLARYCIPMEERPADDELNHLQEPVVFCKKGCYSKWWSAKKKEKKALFAAEKAAKNVKKRKVPWEEDGSLELLMEWLTTEGNYAEYCGATQQGQKQVSIPQRDCNFD